MIAGPDSRAQIAIQAAQRVGWNGNNPFSDTVPWDVCPPLAPALIAWLAKTPGMSLETAYIALVWVAFLGASAAVFRLWRVMEASTSVAIQAAVLAFLAPSGWIAIFERGEIDRLLFWKLVPLVVLAIDIFRRKPNLIRIALILSTVALVIFTRSTRFIAFDLLALAEWIVLFALCRPWLTDATTTRVVRLAGAAAFVLVATVRLQALREPGALPPMPEALVAQAPAPVIGPVSLDASLHPELGKIHALINGDLRPHESILWLQALGARSVIAPAHGKYARYLECVAEEQGWCVFDTGSPAPPAVLVSRERFETLEPIRGLFDVDGLERYLLWARRPEAVGYERSKNQATVKAEVGLEDLVLVRLRARDWVEDEASFSRWPIQDPLGFSVVDFAKPSVLTGNQRNRIPMRFFGDHPNFAGPRPDPIYLDDADYPRILPEGVVEATAYTPPPFQPGAYLAIFGERFRSGDTQVLLDGQESSVIYSSSTQINIQLPTDIAPGPHELVLNAANHHSYPYRFEVTAP